MVKTKYSGSADLSTKRLVSLCTQFFDLHVKKKGLMLLTWFSDL